MFCRMLYKITEVLKNTPTPQSAEAVEYTDYISAEE